MKNRRTLLKYTTFIVVVLTIICSVYSVHVLTQQNALLKSILAGKYEVYDVVKTGS